MVAWLVVAPMMAVMPLGVVRATAMMPLRVMRAMAVMPLRVVPVVVVMPGPADATARPTRDRAATRAAADAAVMRPPMAAARACPIRAPACL
jgi:hypothetical protein